MTLREIVGRLMAWRHRERLDRQVADDLQMHVDYIARDLQHSGMTAEDAQHTARRRVGNLTALREQSRQAWGFPALERTWRDLRHAIRSLLRAPTFTFSVILTLALGIGANAAMFGVIDRLMFRPFPLIIEPDMVQRVYLQTTFEGRTNTSATFPYTRFLDMQRGSRQFSDYAAVSEWRLAVGRGAAVHVRKVAGVSASLFGFFDAPPVLGRYFSSEEDQAPLGAMVAILGEGLWRTDYGARDVIGHVVKIGKLDYTVIGVAPDAFVGTVAGGRPDVFVPITTIPANINPSSQNDFYTAYNWDWTEMLVRRRADVTVDAASTDLTNAYIGSRAAARAINPRVRADSLSHPKALAGAVRSAAGPAAGGESRVLLWVSGVALLVLLIACASVSNLMLARVVRRRREVTLRLALGISRGRLVGQFLTEGIVLATAGGAAGLLVAQRGGMAVRRLLLPEGTEFALWQDMRTIGVVFACVLVCAVLIAIGPLSMARRTDLAGMLRGGARDGGFQRSRLQVTMLVAQVSLSVVMLVGAALFVKSFQQFRALPLGYDVVPVVEAVADFRGVAIDGADRARAIERVMDAARAIPGVTHVAQANSRLFGTNTAALRVQGIDSVEHLGRFNKQIAGPEYFDVMHIGMLRGRGIEARDVETSSRVAVVSEAMATVLWPDREPLGQCLYVSTSGAPGEECTEVVGIAQNTMQHSLTDDPGFMYYLPVAQAAPGGLSTILIRTSVGKVQSQLETIRRTLTAAMPGDGFVVVAPLQDVVDDRARAWRLGATLFTVFGALALIVAVVGLYGIISYHVDGRMHELGVRVALGAKPRHILRVVVMQAARLALIGVAIGVALALVASRWLQPTLFLTSAKDPSVYFGVALAMMIVALAASAVPAIRAARANPLQAMQAD